MTSADIESFFEKVQKKLGLSRRIVIFTMRNKNRQNMKSTELSKVISVVTGKVGIYEFKETICIVTGLEKGRHIDVAYPIESNHKDMLCSAHFVSCSPADTFDLTIRAATPSEISRWKYAKGVGASYRKKLKSADEATNIPWVSAVVTNS